MKKIILSFLFFLFLYSVFFGNIGNNLAQSQTQRSSLDNICPRLEGVHLSRCCPQVVSQPTPCAYSKKVPFRPKYDTTVPSGSCSVKTITITIQKTPYTIVTEKKTTETQVPCCMEMQEETCADTPVRFDFISRLIRTAGSCQFESCPPYSYWVGGTMATYENLQIQDGRMPADSPNCYLKTCSEPLMCTAVRSGPPCRESDRLPDCLEMDDMSYTVPGTTPPIKIGKCSEPDCWRFNDPPPQPWPTPSATKAPIQIHGTVIPDQNTANVNDEKITNQKNTSINSYLRVENDPTCNTTLKGTEYIRQFPYGDKKLSLPMCPLLPVCWGYDPIPLKPIRWIFSSDCTIDTHFGRSYYNKVDPSSTKNYSDPNGFFTIPNLPECYHVPFCWRDHATEDYRRCVEPNLRGVGGNDQDYEFCNFYGDDGKCYLHLNYDWFYFGNQNTRNPCQTSEDYYLPDSSPESLATLTYHNTSVTVPKCITPTPPPPRVDPQVPTSTPKPKPPNPDIPPD